MEKQDMYFYRLEKDRVVKYRISFRESVMKNYREQIIKESSVIIPKEIFSLTPPEGENIFNVKRGERIFEPQNGYRYTYDVYEFSPLVSWIDRLLDGDNRVLPLFLGDDYSQVEESKKVSFLPQIEELNAQCDKMENSDPEKIVKLRELQSLLSIEKRNKDQKDPFYLFYIVRQNLSMIIKDYMSLDEVTRLVEFIGKTPEELGMYGIKLSDAEITPEEEKKQL